MIGKQIKGTSFRGVLDYLENKTGAKLIGSSNMLGSDAQSLAAEFRATQQLNPNLKKVVYHASLSLPHHEKLSDKTWVSFCQDYLEGMGFDNNQYVIYRHNDREHDHVHIVASRIKMDGSTVNDSWDYVRSERLLRRLEPVYGLSSPLEKDPLNRSATTGQKQRVRREQAEWQQRLRTIPPDVPKIERLQSLIRACASDQPTMPILVQRLENQGVECQITTYADGMPRGISFNFSGQKFSGTQLGKGYTFKGLQKHLQVSFNETQIEDLQQSASGFQFRHLPERSKRADSDKFYSKQLDKYIDKVIARQREPSLQSEIIGIIKQAETIAHDKALTFPTEPELICDSKDLAEVCDLKMRTLEDAFKISKQPVQSSVGQGEKHLTLQSLKLRLKAIQKYMEAEKSRELER